MCRSRSRRRPGVTRHRTSSVLAAVVLLGLFSPRATAAPSVWIAPGNGNFDNAANWSNGVPGLPDTAIFNRGNGVTYTTNFPSAITLPIAYKTDTLRVGGNNLTFVRSAGATYTVTNPTAIENGRGIIIGEQSGDAALLNLRMPLSAVAATLGDGAGANGTLNLTLGSFTLTGSSDAAGEDELIVGNSGTGALNISPGLTVSLTGQFGNTVIGNRTGSSGAVSVNGGALNIADPTTGTGTLKVGVSGSGTLNVSNGGQLIHRVQATIGDKAGGVGTATVDGAASLWNVTDGLLIVGNLGQGTLNVTGGGAVHAQTVLAGELDGSIGAINVQGAGSVLTTPNLLSVGVQNSTGTLSVTAGGQVISGAARLGIAATASGAATVSGAGSSWTINGNLLLASLASFPVTLSRGSLTVADGGLVSVAGDVSGGSGLSTVTLDGGTLDLQNHEIAVSNLDARGGTLKNVSQINSGGSIRKVTAGTLVLDGTNTYTGRTLVDAGRLVVKTSFTTGSEVSAADGAVVEVATSAATPHNVVLRTGSVTIPGTGRLDLRDNKLIVTAQDVGAWNGVAYTGVLGMVQSGYHGGAWDGAGIMTSAVAPAGRSLAVARADDVGYAGQTFGGVPVVAADVLVMYTLAGDANLDGTVGFADLVRVAQNYNSTGGAWSHGDFTYDGVVNFADLVKLAQNYGGTLPAGGVPGAPVDFAGDLAAAFARVPEPGVALTVATAALTVARRRSRRTRANGEPS